MEEEEEEEAAAEKERLYLLARGANGQGRSCTVHFPTANGKPDTLSNLLHEFLPWRAMGKNPSHRGSSVLGLRPARWPWPHQQHVRVCMCVCVCARADHAKSYTHYISSQEEGDGEGKTRRGYVRVRITLNQAGSSKS